MNKLSITKIKLARGIAGTFILCAVTLSLSGLLAQSSEKPSTRIPTVTPTPTQWPSMQDRDKVKMGFTRALNRSARDKDYRDALLDFTKPDVVREKVQEELRKVQGCQNMTIPAEIVLIFYVPQPSRKGVTPTEMPKEMKDFLEKWENRNVHVFYLPDFNDTTDHPYDLHIMCCYRPW